MAGKIKRLCIYFFYDADGIADRYVFYMLSAMRPYCAELEVVSNGALDQASKRKFEEIADLVVQRENIGFDVWAYKTMLERYGWQALSAFDEVILMNHTIMGPVYPMEEVFSKMDQQDVDFWGLTTYHQLAYDPMGKCKFGYIPLHLQSHFIALRKSLLQSEALHAYWDSMPQIYSYEEAICFHEAIFTKTFADLGFCWSAYVDTSDLVNHNACPLIYTPVKIIREKRCPILKRRSFFHDYDDLCAHSLGDQGREILEYLQAEIQYDTDLIWENILRTCNLADIQKCLCLYHILPLHDMASTIQTQSFALVIHLHYEECFSYCLRYALSMPDRADLYLTTTSEEKRRALLKIFSNGPWKRLEVRVVENRGRDVSALLVGCKDLASRYDLICFAHDKMSHKGEMEIVGENFSEHCFRNLLGSRVYVDNIVGLFRREPRLGLLFPPPPYHGGYSSIIGEEWTCNYDNVLALAKKLHLRVPIDRSREPVAPLGTMFWFRPKALAPLFNADWDNNDFPPEPNGLDGTLLHAIERIYPFAAQQSGYYSAWCMNDYDAPRYTITLCHMLRGERFQSNHGSIGRFLRLRLKRAVKARSSACVWNAARLFYLKSGGKKWIG